MKREINKRRKSTHHLPSADQCPASLQTRATSEADPPFFFLHPGFYCSARFMVQNNPLATSGQLSPLCPLPNSWLSQAYSLGSGGKAKKYKALALCKYPLATAKTPKLQSLISILVATNPKHSPLGCYGGGSSLHPSQTQDNIFTGSIK